MDKENVEKIIPAYQKKAENIEKEKLKKNKKPKKHFKSKITVILILVLVTLIVAVSNLIYFTLQKSKYKEYSQKLKKYGFVQLYNNGKATEYSKVTKIEALKMILAASLNRTDIRYLLPTSQTSETITTDEEEIEQIKVIQYQEKYPNSMWVDYLLLRKIFTEEQLNEKEMYEDVTLLDVLTYISIIKKQILNIDPNASEQPSFKNYQSYKAEEQTIIADAVKSNIIENSQKNFNGSKKLKKGELSKIIVNYVENYDLITIKNSKLNINKEKIPDNIENYPYTISSVEKSVYEIADYKEDSKLYQSSLLTFFDKRKDYSAISEIATEYFNIILNIDYENLDEYGIEEIKDRLDIMYYYYSNMDSLDEYLDYVKKNKIKLTGSAKFQEPVVYFDGQMYRARLKIQFSVQSSDTLENLLFKDASVDKKIEYKNDNNQYIIDLPMIISEEGIYVYPVALSKMIAGSVEK